MSRLINLVCVWLGHDWTSQFRVGVTVTRRYCRRCRRYCLYGPVRFK